MRHAELTGNATSQSMVGFFYATGFGGVVDVDQSQVIRPDIHTDEDWADGQGAEQEGECTPICVIFVRLEGY